MILFFSIIETKRFPKIGVSFQQNENLFEILKRIINPFGYLKIKITFTNLFDKIDFLHLG
jgi:hypothetical protein